MLISLIPVRLQFNTHEKKKWMERALDFILT